MGYKDSDIKVYGRFWSETTDGKIIDASQIDGVIPTDNIPDIDTSKLTGTIGHLPVSTDDATSLDDQLKEIVDTIERIPGSAIGLLNIKNGEGAGSIQQVTYKMEDVYKDFRHYAAAYGVASAQGDGSVEAVEALMSAYTYEQLLGMIAQANFGGDTEQAQTYIYGMIDSTLQQEGLEIVENVVNGSSSSAFGLGNTIYSPTAFVTGYKNIIGRKGYPQETIGAFASGVGMMVSGKGAFAAGNAQSFTPSVFGNEEIQYARKHIRNLKQWFLDSSNKDDYAKSRLPSEIATATTNAELDAIVVNTGEAHGTGTVAFGGSTFAQNSFVSGYSNWNNGSEAFVAGNQNVNGKPSAFVAGLLNYNGGNASFMAGQENHNESAASFIFGNNNKLINGANRAAIGYNLLGGFDTANRGQLITGRHNADVDALFIVGNGDENSRSNALEVMEDGRVKGYGTPKDPEDFVRMEEIHRIKDIDINLEDLTDVILWEYALGSQDEQRAAIITSGSVVGQANDLELAAQTTATASSSGTGASYMMNVNFSIDFELYHSTAYLFRSQSLKIDEAAINIEYLDMYNNVVSFISVTMPNTLAFDGTLDEMTQTSPDVPVKVTWSGNSHESIHDIAKVRIRLSKVTLSGETRAMLKIR